MHLSDSWKAQILGNLDGTRWAESRWILNRATYMCNFWNNVARKDFNMSKRRSGPTELIGQVRFRVRRLVWSPLSPESWSLRDLAKKFKFYDQFRHFIDDLTGLPTSYRPDGTMAAWAIKFWPIYPFRNLKLTQYSPNKHHIGYRSNNVRMWLWKARPNFERPKVVETIVIFCGPQSCALCWNLIHIQLNGA